MLDVRHLQENYWLNLHSTCACLGQWHKLLHLHMYMHSHKTTKNHNLNDIHQEARLNIVNLCLHELHPGKTDPTFILSSSEKWFNLNGHLNSQNNRQ